MNKEFMKNIKSFRILLETLIIEEYEDNERYPNEEEFGRYFHEVE